MMFTPKLPIMIGLVVIGVVGCSSQTQSSDPSSAPKENSVMEKIVGSVSKDQSSNDISSVTLSEITHKARKGELSDKEIDKALKEVVAFMEDIETQTYSEKEMLKLYHYGEVLKRVGPEKNAPTIHEIGNWANTYLKGQLLGKEGVELETLLHHKDGLIEKALDKWNELSV